MTLIDWLLDSDPSIRWQVMRDLTNEPAEVIAAERARVATEGWGARLLELQAPDGLWAGNAFSQDRPNSSTENGRSFRTMKSILVASGPIALNCVRASRASSAAFRST